MYTTQHTFDEAGDHSIQILVVENEQPLLHLLQKSLERLGYSVLLAVDGRTALEMFDELRNNADETIDLVLLDGAMPNMDGFTTCTELRKRSDIPIVMLTAVNRPEDIARGFELGVDDYITKPFTFREVAVRLQAVLRRMQWREKPAARATIVHPGIELNEQTQTVSLRHLRIHLTPIECRLLSHLMRAPSTPISKRILFRKAWGYEEPGSDSLVDVAIRQLRSKLEIEPDRPQILRTVRDVGYTFCPLSNEQTD